MHSYSYLYYYKRLAALTTSQFKEFNYCPAYTGLQNIQTIGNHTTGISNCKLQGAQNLPKKSLHHQFMAVLHVYQPLFSIFILFIVTLKILMISIPYNYHAAT